MTRKTCLILVAVLLLLIIAGLLITASFATTAPIWDGSAEDYWYVTTLINLDNIDKGHISWGGFLTIYLQDYCYYSRFHLHGFDVFRAPTSEVNLLFPKLIENLENKTSHKDPNNPAYLGYLSWKSSPDKDKNDIEELIYHINETRIKDVCNRNFNYASRLELYRYLMAVRVDKSRWYWANFVFEFTFLTGLVIWFLWPGIKQLKFRLWLIRVLFLPFLFFLPWYLGYVPWSVTTYGPRGGVFYPWLMLLSRVIRPWKFLSSFEYWIVEHTPALLEILTHDTGSPLTHKDTFPFPMCGPIQAIIIGITAALILIVLRFICLFLKKVENKSNCLFQ